MVRLPCKRKLGVTLVEIIVVASISCVVMTMAMLIMNRTTRQFQRGTDMLNIQRLMDNIVENIRTDIRSLKKVIPDKCDDNSFSFFAIKDGKEEKITYKYDEKSKTLFKIAGSSNRKSNFHGSKQVVSFMFKPVPEIEELKKNARFKYLNVIMQLKSDSKKNRKASSLSIICQFNSTCVEQDLNLNKLRSSQ